MLNLTPSERDEAELRAIAMRFLAMCDTYNEFVVVEAARYIRQECGEPGARLANLMTDMADGTAQLP